CSAADVGRGAGLVGCASSRQDSWWTVVAWPAIGGGTVVGNLLRWAGRGTGTALVCGQALACASREARVHGHGRTNDPDNTRPGAGGTLRTQRLPAALLLARSGPRPSRALPARGCLGPGCHPAGMVDGAPGVRLGAV